MHSVSLIFPPYCVWGRAAKSYIREVKHDVYGKRQTAKMTLLTPCTVESKHLYLQRIVRPRANVESKSNLIRRTYLF